MGTSEELHATGDQPKTFLQHYFSPPLSFCPTLSTAKFAAHPVPTPTSTPLLTLSSTALYPATLFFKFFVYFCREIARVFFPLPDQGMGADV